MSQLLKVFGIRDRRSFANISGSPLAVRTNVLNSSSGASNSGIIHIPNRTLSNYLSTMQECKSYECFGLVVNIMKLLTDYVTNQMDLETRDYVEVPDDEKLTKEVIDLINETDYNNKFIRDLHDIIYYGGKGYKIEKSKRPTSDEFRIKLVDLLEPYIITKDYSREPAPDHYDRFIQDRVTKSYSVYQGRGSVNVDYNEILFLGDQDFKLTETWDDDYSAQSGFKRKRAKDNRIEDNLDRELATDNYSVYAALPLMYSVIHELKNYIVYKTLSYVLALKDALIPSFMRLGVDLTKATTTDKINETVNELESKINEAVDTTLIMGQQLQIDQLINAVFSNVRVLPDPGNLLSSVDALNLDPLKEKLDEINGKLEDSENSILDTLGIPSDLFDGGSNQYEVTTRNERYQTTVGSILTLLKKIYKDNVIKLYMIKHPNTPKAVFRKLQGLVCRLFRVSSIDITKTKNIIDQNSELADSLQKLTDTFKDMIENNPLVNNEVALGALKSITANLGPVYKDIIVDKVPEKTEGGSDSSW